MKINRRKAFIGLFSVLYICVAFVSTFHAIAFFGLANSLFLAVILAVTFEIGQATVLLSILTNKEKSVGFMPWVLMGILTLVQVMGNVYSSYKYLITNATEDLKYFKDPIFMWTDLPNDQCNVILSYIIGAILPIVALCMTEMFATTLNDKGKDNFEYDITETSETVIPEKEVEQSTEKTIVEKNEEPTEETEHTITNKEEETTKTPLKSGFINL